MWNALLGLLFYNGIVAYLFIKYKRCGSQPISTNNYWRVIWIFVLFGVIGVQFGDYPHYEEIVHDVYKQSLRYSGDSWMEGLHMEPLYNRLVVLCKGNYFLWRLIWFTVEFLAFGVMFKRLGHNNYQSLFVFSTCALFSVCAGRVSWGLIFFFLGFYTFFQTKEYKYLCFVLISFFAHNSMLVLFALTPVLLIRSNKKIIFISIIMVPFLVGLFGVALQNMLQLSFLPEAITHKLSTNYMDTERTGNLGGSIGEYIYNLCGRIPLYYLIIRYFIDVIKKKIVVPYKSQKFFNLIIVLFALTQVALFSDFGSASLYVRFFSMLYVPIFLLVYCSNGWYYFKTREFKLYMFLLWTAFNLNYFKAAYYYSVG